MAITVVDPVARIEGHMKIRLQIEDGVVADARASGTMYRGFENLMAGRVAGDAPLITQRICGVCPASHGVASVLAMDDAAGVQPPPEGRLLRNLILAAEFIHSHLLHFYQLALPDYIDLGSVLNTGPWAPIYGGDRRVTGDDLARLADSTLAALRIRRKAHTVGAMVAGKQPHAASLIPGGCSAHLTGDQIDAMESLTGEIRAFVQDVYLPDLALLFDPAGGYYGDLCAQGTGPGRLLAYGVFEQGAGSPEERLIRGGVCRGTGSPGRLDAARIVEDVTASWYTDPDGLHPHDGTTTPAPGKPDAYSWIKSPRYRSDGAAKEVCELGPLARMVVNGDYPYRVSAADREIARGVETLKIAEAMLGWLETLRETPGPSYVPYPAPAGGSGVGLSEAARGALGHWVAYGADGAIAHYQIITPTCWNASPRDADGVPGAMEQALVGTPVADESAPIEALRIIHSYDPCLACSVHVLRTGGETCVLVLGP